MKRFHAFAIAGLAALGLSTACEKRAPTADTQGRGYVESRDPNAPGSSPSTTTTPSTDTTGAAPSGTAGSDLDRQPVSGTGGDTAATTPTTPDSTGTGTTTSTDVYWVADDGERTVISDSTLITRVQQKLKEAGVYQGETDGRVSAELGPAIRQYQAKRGLPQSGAIDKRTADALGVDWDKAKVSGRDEGQTATDAIKEGGAKIEAGANEALEGTRAGAAEAGRDLEAGANEAAEETKAAGSELQEGTKELGKDLESGAKRAGEEAKEAGEDVKDFVNDKSK